MTFRPFARPTDLEAQILVPKKYFSSFLFFNCISTKKFVKAVINDFKKNLVISNWLGRQKSRQKRKTMSQKEVEVKEGTVYVSFFFHLNNM